MEIELEFFAKLRSGVKEQIEVFLYSRGVVFFANQVIADDHLAAFIGLDGVVKLLLNLASTNDLQADDNDSHLEEWEELLDVFLHPFEDGHFLFNGDLLAVVIEEATEDVAVLDNGAHLLDVVLRHAVQDLLEEGGVAVKRTGQEERILEVLPDAMVLAMGWAWCQDDFIVKPLVKVFGFVPVLAQSVDFHVAVFVATLG